MHISLRSQWRLIWATLHFLYWNIYYHYNHLWLLFIICVKRVFTHLIIDLSVMSDCALKFQLLNLIIFKYHHCWLGGYFLPTCPAPIPGVSGVHLDVKLRVLLKVVEEFLVVTELSVPLARIRVSKVVTERNEKNRRTKETRLLTVLIQQEESSERTTRQHSDEPRSVTHKGRNEFTDKNNLIICPEAQKNGKTESFCKRKLIYLFLWTRSDASQHWFFTNVLI